MHAAKRIDSLQNPTIKRLVQLLEKSRSRKKERLFVVEGMREMQLALKGGYSLKDFFVVDGLADVHELDALIEKYRLPQPTLIAAALYQKLAYRSSTEGILALMETKEHGLEDLQLSDNPLLLVAEAPEKPGNIGALLRTADAAHLDGVIIANPKTDLYNPNIIRSSVGCVFTTPVAMAPTEAIIRFLQNNKIDIYAAALTASRDYREVNFQGPAAIVVGTEATGLEDAWLNESDQNIIIPMEGEIDSLNVSVSAAILIFEAKRQRKK